MFVAPWCALAAAKSRFAKDVNVDALEKVCTRGRAAGRGTHSTGWWVQEWADGKESEDWHEDTYEWKEKLAKQKRPNVEFDPKNPGDFM